MTDSIKIKGGAYKWADTHDGYFTILDVPLMAECPEGTKGAPYPVTKAVLEEFRDTAQSRYNQGHFCATAFVGHNPDVAITHPDFAGYTLPNRVGEVELEGGKKWALFGDLKIDKAHFELAKAGKLPYTSPEVPWAKRRVSGLAFLDTQPPYFEFALFTLGEEVTSAAKFEVTPGTTAQFAEGEHKEPDGDEPGLADHIDKAIGKHMERHVGRYMDEYMKKHGEEHFAAYMKKATAAKMSASEPRKPTNLPVEPEKTEEGGAKMATDPKDAAKFTALESTVADLTAKMAAQENKEKAARLVEKIKAAFRAKIVSPALDTQIAKYSAEWAPLADAEKRADEYAAALAPSLKDKPTAPATFGAGAPADVTDPVVAKFAQQGPEALEEAGKFAAQFEELKRGPGGRFMKSSKEDYVKLQMGLAKARSEGLFSENGR